MSSRPIFDPVDTSFDPSQHSRKDDVESPSLSSGNALARFEFEPGRSKDGTKVLMVEWQEDSTTRSLSGNWEIRWEGKKTVLPVQEDSEQQGAVNRIYFMLGPGVTVPTSVKLQKGGVTWRTNPLPAIFSPELGITARQAGRKGVLHTIWAKKRLQVLQKEIECETAKNTEGIGLEMSIAEKEWIETNFGVVAKPSAQQQQQPQPTSPLGPGRGSGRLMEKMKGLKLGTSEGELKSSGAPPAANPLSPETSDVAVGGFGSFAALKGMPDASSLAAKSPQPPTVPSKIAAHMPPDSFAGQRRQEGGMGSLNAVASNDVESAPIQPAADDAEDDLFALPMSPRSPDMAKSPFSFAAVDIMKYTKA